MMLLTRDRRINQKENKYLRIKSGATDGNVQIVCGDKIATAEWWRHFLSLPAAPPLTWIMQGICWCCERVRAENLPLCCSRVKWKSGPNSPDCIHRLTRGYDVPTSKVSKFNFTREQMFHVFKGTGTPESSLQLCRQRNMLPQGAQSKPDDLLTKAAVLMFFLSSWTLQLWNTWAPCY